MGHLTISMDKLQAHLSAMPCKEEVCLNNLKNYQLTEGDGSTFVLIQSEYVFHDVINFLLRLLA